MYSQWNSFVFFLKRLKELKRIYCEEKERYESIECVNEMQKRLEELKHKMAWAVVNFLIKCFLKL